MVQPVPSVQILARGVDFRRATTGTQPACSKIGEWCFGTPPAGRNSFGRHSGTLATGRNLNRQDLGTLVAGKNFRI